MKRQEEPKHDHARPPVPIGWKKRVQTELNGESTSFIHTNVCMIQSLRPTRLAQQKSYSTRLKPRSRYWVWSTMTRVFFFRLDGYNLPRAFYILRIFFFLPNQCSRTQYASTSLASPWWWIATNWFTLCCLTVCDQRILSLCVKDEPARTLSVLMMPLGRKNGLMWRPHTHIARRLVFIHLCCCGQPFLPLHSRFTYIQPLCVPASTTTRMIWMRTKKYERWWNTW